MVIKSLTYITINYIINEDIDYKNEPILPEFKLILNDLVKINKIYGNDELSDYDLCINSYLKGLINGADYLFNHLEIKKINKSKFLCVFIEVGHVSKALTIIDSGINIRYLDYKAFRLSIEFHRESIYKYLWKKHDILQGFCDKWLDIAIMYNNVAFLEFMKSEDIDIYRDGRSFGRALIENSKDVIIYLK